MKKLLLALLLTIGINAAEPILLKNKSTYTETNPIGYVDYDYYVGVLGSINQTSKKMENTSFFGHGEQEFTNIGIGLNAAIKLIEYDNINTYIEARVLKSFYMEDLEYINTESWGIYLKPKFIIFKNISLYGLLGVANVKYTLTKSNNTSFSGSGISTGVGAEIDGRNNIGFTVDYVATEDNVDLSILGGDSIHSTITVGIIYRFDLN